MARETNERYIGDQVRSRANVILTRRDDLRVVETKEQTGLDIHVYVDREDKPMRIVFGVLLRGVPSPTTAEYANKVLGPTMGFFQGLRKFTYPVCLFFFTVRQDSTACVSASIARSSHFSCCCRLGRGSASGSVPASAAARAISR